MGCPAPAGAGWKTGPVIAPAADTRPAAARQRPTRRRGQELSASKHASARSRTCRGGRRAPAGVSAQVTSGFRPAAAPGRGGSASYNDPLNKSDPLGLRPGEGDFLDSMCASPPEVAAEWIYADQALASWERMCADAFMNAGYSCGLLCPLATHVGEASTEAALSLAIATVGFFGGFDMAECIQEYDPASCSWAVVAMVPGGSAGKSARFVVTGSGIVVDMASIGTRLSRGKQLYHLVGTEEWIRAGRKSYFRSLDDAQAVLTGLTDGSTEILAVRRNGDLLVRNSGVMGYNRSVGGSGYAHQATSVFIVKGSTRPKVIPTNPLKLE